MYFATEIHDMENGKIYIYLLTLVELQKRTRWEKKEKAGLQNTILGQ